MGKYRKLSITLTEEQRDALEKKVNQGKCSAIEIRRANVILMVDGSQGKGMKDVDVASALGITQQSVHNIKSKFLESQTGAEEARNRRQKGIDWQFSVGDARTKLKQLYPGASDKIRCYKVLATTQSLIPVYLFFLLFLLPQLALHIPLLHAWRLQLQMP